MTTRLCKPTQRRTRCKSMLELVARNKRCQNLRRLLKVRQLLLGETHFKTSLNSQIKIRVEETPIQMCEKCSCNHSSLYNWHLTISTPPSFNTAPAKSDAWKSIFWRKRFSAQSVTVCSGVNSLFNLGVNRI